ncbi:cytochrome c peroxidase [Flavobacterium sp. LAR06]|uniref:cytochrome c peroxidase n=1 Tax=Flavobacterium sp. LAR06 TaxID=3064897 RepID=UPI0035C2287C
MGEKLFSEKRFSADNTISCSTCHIQANAFTDHNAQAVGSQGRVGLRNTPSLQNLAFLKFTIETEANFSSKHSTWFPSLPMKK